MKSDHRVILCCALAWLCCAVVNCRGGVFDGNRNALKERNSLEDDWFESDDEIKILEDLFRREPYHERRVMLNNEKSEATPEDQTKCDCGEFSVGCNFVDDKKVCQCQKTYSEKNGKCEKCECGEFSDGCEFVDDKKVCQCKKTYSEKNGKCEKCTCGENTKSCVFIDGEKSCTCIDNFALKDGKCTGTCIDDKSCKHGAKCSEIGGNMFCVCLKGTSGDTCDIADDCETGIFKECSGDKGNCTYDVQNERAKCNCDSNKKLKDKSGYCEECECGEFSDGCEFVDDKKVCQCKKTYSEKNGKCEKCECGEFSDGCDFVDDKKVCQCKKTYSEKNGKCEICTCGENTKSCTFKDGQKRCTCNEKFSLKDEKCEECNCGENTKSCVFTDGQISCTCNDKFVLKDGKCAALCETRKDCKNGGDCVEEEGSKTCRCLPGTSGDFCQEVDDCLGIFKNCTGGAKGDCKYDTREEEADCVCPEKKAFRESIGYCDDCDCGENTYKCNYVRNVKRCDCQSGFILVEGECKNARCINACGVTSEVECKFNDTDVECTCKDTEKKFDSNKKECRGTCTEDKSCNHGAECSEVNGNKFCDCRTGTSGDTCDIVDVCTSGKYKDCSGAKGNCTYDIENEIAKCTCDSNKKLKEKSGYCEECECGPKSKECSFVGDQRTCVCEDGFADKKGTCEKCECGLNSKKCSFVGDQRTCVCEDGYADNNGMCEKCDCGENTKDCSFKNGQKTCTCNEKYALKDGKCEECDCGEKQESCNFQVGIKTCRCQAGFSPNDGHCEVCDCGKNATGCSFKEGAKICQCKKDFAQNDDKCEECKCEMINTKKCRFEHGEKTCDCKEKFALKGKICTDCNCGAKSKGCTFDEGDQAECQCETGYANNKGKCAEDRCYTKCGVMQEEDHEEIKCEGDKFGDREAIKCICHNDEKKFHSQVKQCRETCSTKKDAKDEKKCKHGATCYGDEDKFCFCLSGTTGDYCSTVTECEEGKTYGKCKDDKGNCAYNITGQKANCKCTGNKMLDPEQGYCQDKCNTDKDCSADKICFKNSYCTCEEGKTGENCDIIPGCTDKVKQICEKGGAICDFAKNKRETNFTACRCEDENFVYNEKDNKCLVKFCNDVGCKLPAVCAFDNKIGYCICPSGKYYDYNRRSCTEPDKCLLKKTPCKENEVCENGACKCKGEKKDDKCIINLCKDTCFTKAVCDENDGTCKCEDGKYYTGSTCADLKCVQDPFHESCPCGKGMKGNEESKACEPTGQKKACDNKKCGMGYCVDDKCFCIDGISTLHEDKCVLDKGKVCASKNLTDDLSKCRCAGKYKHAKDGITCELVTCSDDVAKDYCKSKGATCQMNWKGTSPGYDCKCPNGYIRDEITGICTDACSQYANALECSLENKVCYNSYSASNDVTSTCGCAPPFQSDTCRELAPYIFLISGIPVQKKRYEMQHGIDYVKLNSHLMQSLAQMYSKDIFDSGYLQDYVVEDDVLKTSVWVRFKANASQELWKFKVQAQNFANLTCEDCDKDLYVWPPYVVLNSKGIDEVKVESLSLCAKIVKDKLCGKEADCKDNKCFCPRGYRTLENTIFNIGDKARILRCEEQPVPDLDECALNTHQCPQNTTCVKIPGSYICKCKPGYWKSTVKDQKDCVDLCTPSPCGKGTCSMKNDKFNCKCQAGYGGSLCDEQDMNFAAAKKSTVVVGAVLGTILIVGVLGVLFFYIKKRKNSFSEDFMPAPRQDNAAEMRERRPMRGIVNTSYE